MTIGLGTAAIGGLYEELDDATALATLEAAWSAGIRYFDTAPHYGVGVAERRLGAFLRRKPRHEFTVSTKVGRLLRPGTGGTERFPGATELVRRRASTPRSPRVSNAPAWHGSTPCSSTIPTTTGTRRSEPRTPRWPGCVPRARWAGSASA